jgi:hypothetical protein
MTLTVACVLRTGQRVVDKQPYSVAHVVKLRNGVAAHLTTPHRFVCLTDQIEAVTAAGIDTLPLVVDYPGWWSKMNLYAPDLLTGPTLYLDLDSLVVGPLEPLFRTTPGITMVPDFYYPETMNSSAMAWRGDLSGLWEAFTDNATRIMQAYDAYGKARVGDQGYVHDTLAAMGEPIGVFDPGHVVSLKRDCKDGPPPDARVISCHGRPKCDSPEAGWAFEAWQAL